MNGFPDEETRRQMAKADAARLALAIGVCDGCGRQIEDRPWGFCDISISQLAEMLDTLAWCSATCFGVSLLRQVASINASVNKVAPVIDVSGKAIWLTER